MFRRSSDRELRKLHERMEQTGERPPYLTETYSSLRSLQKEAYRLAALGYRIRSRQDMRDASGYNVSFVYMGMSQTRDLA
jgi:hypothetical protein